MPRDVGLTNLGCQATDYMYIYVCGYVGTSGSLASAACTQSKGKAGTSLKYDSVLSEMREQSQAGVLPQQFDAALKILQDEDFLVVSGQNIRLC